MTVEAAPPFPPGNHKEKSPGAEQSRGRESHPRKVVLTSPPSPVFAAKYTKPQAVNLVKSVPDGQWPQVAEESTDAP